MKVIPNIDQINRADLILSANRALQCEIRPNMRRISVEFRREEKKSLYFSFMIHLHLKGFLSYLLNYLHLLDKIFLTIYNTFLVQIMSPMFLDIMLPVFLLWIFQWKVFLMMCNVTFDLTVLKKSNKKRERGSMMKLSAYFSVKCK